MSNATENELLETVAKMLGLSVTQYLMQRACPDDLMRNICNDFRGGLPQSTSMLPDNQRSKPVARGSGWVPEVPLKSPPGAEPGGLIDRMVENQDRQERRVKINMQIAEELRALELQQKLRDAELDPTGFRAGG